MPTTEYIYLTIPQEYVCVYHKLLILMSNIGKEIMSDCQSTCKGNNKYIIDCWNMFQSAIACRQLDKTKEADLLINYIKQQINLLYKGKDVTYQNTFVYIDDSYLKARVTCNNDVAEVDVDFETGELYEVKNAKDTELNIVDNNLTIKEK